MLNKEKHRTIMFNIIKDIFNSEIGQYLAFKGGTACYFLYSLDRFSTDLDFDLLDSSVYIDDVISNILKKYGKIKKGQKLILSYGEEDVNIELDFNRNIWKNNIYENTNFYGTTIKIQDKSTIFTNKLVALTERFTNRDIYDVYFFFKNAFSINEELVVERTGKSLKELLVYIKNKLEKLQKNHKILEGIGEILDTKQKAFVKDRLVNELIGIIELKVKY